MATLQRFIAPVANIAAAGVLSGATILFAKVGVRGLLGPQDTRHATSIDKVSKTWAKANFKGYGYLLHTLQRLQRYRDFACDEQIDFIILSCGRMCTTYRLLLKTTEIDEVRRLGAKVMTLHERVVKRMRHVIAEFTRISLEPFTTSDVEDICNTVEDQLTVINHNTESFVGKIVQSRD